MVDIDCSNSGNAILIRRHVLIAIRTKGKQYNKKTACYPFYLTR
ncbi:hypothetical protein EDWATA_00506 [Edwardsiella tarda ATCC 23685]|uniref:Uncharacterized protein n=1 Tax=Edwardsiella tarda ATCC 23685 TaxID=500638 RepID=D4F1C1_EDWTA|nr:hypothetical protein EDWATA_00506 [Edwardsiella tarda ATCC 23685]